MAFPHVASLVLYLKGLKGLESPKEVTDRLVELATPDIITDPSTGSPTRLPLTVLRSRQWRTWNVDGL